MREGGERRRSGRGRGDCLNEAWQNAVSDQRVLRNPPVWLGHRVEGTGGEEFFCFYKFIYFILFILFLAALGLHCCTWAFLWLWRAGATLRCGAQSSH